MKKMIVLFGFVFILSCIVGCTSKINKDNLMGKEKSTGGVVIANSTSPNSTNTPTSTPTPSNATSIITGNIKIYQITRDVFHLFLKNPTMDIFTDDDIECYECTKSEEWYETNNVTHFSIRQEFLDFVGSFTEVETYLLQNGFNGNVENMLIFDAQSMPMTIWVQTDMGHVYITINEELGDKLYVYRFYQHADFYEKFKSKDAQLIVVGKEITPKNAVRLYHDNADIPLIAVLETLGASVKWENDATAIICYKEKTYYLDIKNYTFYEEGNDDNNLLYQVDGGPIFINAVDYELMMDISSLAGTLYAMGTDVIIRCDSENASVSIVIKE